MFTLLLVLILAALLVVASISDERTACRKGNLATQTAQTAPSPASYSKWICVTLGDDGTATTAHRPHATKIPESL